MSGIPDGRSQTSTKANCGALDVWKAQTKHSTARSSFTLALQQCALQGKVLILRLCDAEAVAFGEQCCASIDNKLRHDVGCESTDEMSFASRHAWLDGFLFLALSPVEGQQPARESALGDSIPTGPVFVSLGPWTGQVQGCLSQDCRGDDAAFGILEENFRRGRPLKHGQTSELKLDGRG